MLSRPAGAHTKSPTGRAAPTVQGVVLQICAGSSPHAARDLIADLPRYNKVPWVFWNPRRKVHMRYVDFYWREFQPEACLRRARPHDLRHTFASHAP